MTISDNTEYVTVRGKGIKNGVLLPHSFVLKDEPLELQPEMWHEFEAPPETACKGSFAFVTGYSGLGRHYRITLDYKHRMIAAHLVRDGINVYLHHLTWDFPGKTIRVEWNRYGLRVLVEKCVILSIFDKDITKGHCGLQTFGVEVPAPNIRIGEKRNADANWCVLGDGFSNARWKERDFLCWPEILFWGRTDFSNLCVSSGNSERILGISRHVRDDLFKNVILAVGNDDAIEKKSLDTFLQNISSTCDALSPENVYVCSLTPRRPNLETVREWNGALENFCSRKGLNFVDLFTPLFGQLDRCIYPANFPNALGQRLMANTLGEHTGIAVGMGDEDHQPDSKVSMRKYTDSFRKSLSNRIWKSNSPQL